DGDTAVDGDNGFGIHYLDSSGTIVDNAVVNVRRADCPACQTGRGIAARAGLGTPLVTIDGNTVHSYQKGGIVVNGLTSVGAPVVTITNNVVTGQGPNKDIPANGIQVAFGATATTIAGNRVTDNIYTQDTLPGGNVVGGNIAVATGILIFQATAPSQGTLASQNRVFRNQSNITIIQ
ncbi:MAG: right-handed parallel beta-helix repeat-containing protein, partial [Acidobacteria bacterium]|nr:right-handed parallel beta-helix repeat-containing protein [Acidobacteriota bacterium]